MLNPKRVQSQSSEQGNLLPTYPSDLVPKDHQARIITEVVNALDLKQLYADYGNEGGRVNHPKSMLKLLFYAYTQGNRSSRRISQDCRENHVYMYISDHLKPNFRTICEFRTRHFGLLEEVFKQVVHICHQIGMIQIGQISLDGTKIKACASDKNIVEKDKLAKELEKIEQEISQMLTEANEVDRLEDEQFGSDNSGAELPEKLKDSHKRQQEIKALLADMEKQGVQKMNPCEQEARFMRGKGRIQMRYNGQCATENQVILAYNLTNEEADTDQLIPMFDQVEELASEWLQVDKDELPLKDVKAATDAGYDSGKNHQYLAQKGIDAYVSGQKDNLKAKEQRGDIPPRPFSKDKFEYHQDGDYYLCPNKQKLYPVCKTKKAKKTYNRTDVVYRCSSCHLCPHKDECVESKTGFRQVTRYPEYDSYREVMEQKLRTESGREMLRYRRTDVEPTFGQLKEAVLRNGSFLLRGLHKAKGEFGLACLAHNLRKIVNYLKSSKNDWSIADIKELNWNPA